MNPGRFLPPQRAVNHAVQREGRQPFGSTNNVRDLHQVVVHGGGQVIQRQSVRFDDDVIVQNAVFDGNRASNDIGYRGRAFFGRLESNDVFFAGCHPPGSFIRVQVAAGAVIMGGFLAFLLFLAYLLQPVGRAKTIIGISGLDQLFGVLLVNLLAFRLAVRAIWAADVRALMLPKIPEVYCARPRFPPVQFQSQEREVSYRHNLRMEASNP